jgi:putative membrane protein
MMGPEHFWWSGMWIFPLVVLTVMLVMVYLMFGRGRPPWRDSPRYREPGSGPETALEILEKRYARGEIKREEFVEMKKDLS